MKEGVTRNLLGALYEDTGHSIGASKLLVLARRKGLKLTLKDVRGFLAEQDTQQIHSAARGGLDPGGHVTAFRENWHAESL